MLWMRFSHEGLPCFGSLDNDQIRVHEGDLFNSPRATGLTLDLTTKGMGLRSRRYSMLVKDGKVATLNIEAPGKFEVSDAATLLAQAKA